MALNYTSLITTCSINEIEFFQVYVSRTQGDLNSKFLISLEAIKIRKIIFCPLFLYKTIALSICFYV